MLNRIIRPARQIMVQVLTYFSLTVKAATLIFISGRGLAISSAKEGKSEVATKLKSDSLSLKQWWKLLNYFIAPNSKSSIPPLETNGQIYAEECEKANILNDFFKDQT